ncbi:hypothetical protein HYPSUDRAFT_649632 [Hypholoma sublateritium FD-334 SS-4]|uniref:Uncharacterized protein n=1 Tax=Hypholoma sublateritium (strain FD-334 SS-4) TaxID=945553 RepID=A0A0D2NUD1_HYPSF|nr:hypothetical protein HYPSUDRAFT_649632 [Hypholoma sublateritium FD-334 SS-4]
MERSRDCPFTALPTKVYAVVEYIGKNMGTSFPVFSLGLSYNLVALVQSFLVFAVGYKYGSILAQAWYLFSGVKVYVRAHTTGVPHLVTLELASQFLFDITIFWFTFLLFLALFLVVLHALPLQHRTIESSPKQEIQFMVEALREAETTRRRLEEVHGQVLLLLGDQLFKTEDTEPSIYN